MLLHFSVLGSNGNEFQFLGSAAEKDDLRVCVFLQKSQSWMILVAFHDVWMVKVPGDILVPDCSCTYINEYLSYILKYSSTQVLKYSSTKHKLKY